MACSFLKWPLAKEPRAPCGTFHSANAFKSLDGPPLVFDLRVRNIHTCAVTAQVKGTSECLRLCLPPKRTPVVWTDRWALQVSTCCCWRLSLEGRFTSPRIIPNCARPVCHLQSLNARRSHYASLLEQSQKVLSRAAVSSNNLQYL